MAKQYNRIQFANAKLYVMYGLAFLVLLFLARCKNPEHKLELLWQNNKAVGIIIPKNGSDLDSVRVVNIRQIFGSVRQLNDKIEFTPVIPLTAGLSYEIWNGTKLIDKITVPFPDAKSAPVLSSIYPERDTVPENLLKFYFYFSKPMQTGQSLAHIFLLDKNRDTLPNVFLNLQPELWDTSGKVLTLWLDPGRIKRNLVLNKKLGNPINSHERYELIVAKQWKDVQGLSLTKLYTKSFVVVQADHQVPSVNTWSLAVPTSGTVLPLVIDTKEGLDHYLLAESIRILGPKKEVIEGEIQINRDQIWEFTPFKPWSAGRYQVQVNARLEDLGANNLNKVFDRDIRKETVSTALTIDRNFTVK